MSFIVDAFTGSASTNLNAHTSDTPASVVWTGAAGTVSLDGTGGVFGNGDYYAAVAPSTANYVVSADFVNKDASASSQTLALWGRWTGTGSFSGYYARISGGSWQIYVWTAGSPSLLGSVSAAFAASETYHVQFSFASSAIKLQVQRASDSQYLTSGGTWQAGQAYAVSVTDTTYSSAGFAGLGCSDAGATASIGLHIANYSATYLTSAATDFGLSPSTLTSPAGVPTSDFTVSVNGFTGSTSTAVALSDGGAGGTFTPSSLTFAGSGSSASPADQTFTYTPLAGLSNGTVITLTATATGAFSANHAATLTIGSTPGTIAISDANILAGLSPNNWYRGTAGRIIAYRPGAYLNLVLSFAGSGVPGLNMDVSQITALTDDTAHRPQLIYSVDGGARTPIAMTEAGMGGSGNNRTIALGGSIGSGSHAIRVWFKAIQSTGSINSITQAIQIRSIAVPVGSTASGPTVLPGKAIFGGDSITECEGVLGLASANYPVNNDASIGFPALVAAALQCEYCCDGIGGASWSDYAGWWSLYDNSHTRLTSGLYTEGAPDWHFVNLGTNGSVGTASVDGVPGTVNLTIAAIHAAAGATCKIVIMVPFGQYLKAGIINEFNYYQGGSSTVTAYTTSTDPVSGATIYKGSLDTKTVLIDLGAGASYGLTYYGSLRVTSTSYEGVHPDARTHGEEAAMIVSATRFAFPSGGGTTVRRRPSRGRI